FKLRPGMFCRVSFIVKEHKNHLVVPRDVLFRIKGKYFIYVVRNGHAQRVEVKPGIFQGNRVEILQGLNEGDVFITEGMEFIRVGALVKTIFHRGTK
ncbi:efflux RND transporter periplasmic adaptor subunit, partial [Candidatus Riflebacteria bacterium]